MPGSGDPAVSDAGFMLFNALFVLVLCYYCRNLICETDKMLLRVYQVLLYLIQPLIWLRLLWRSRRSPAYRRRWGERYGFCKGKTGTGGIILHSVSVGETLAAGPSIPPPLSDVTSPCHHYDTDRLRAGFISIR